MKLHTCSLTLERSQKDSVKFTCFKGTCVWLYTTPPPDRSPERVTEWHFVFFDLLAANTCSRGNEEWFPTSPRQFPHFSLLYTWAPLSGVNCLCLPPPPKLNSDLSPGEIFISSLGRIWSFSSLYTIIPFITTKETLFIVCDKFTWTCYIISNLFWNSNKGVKYSYILPSFCSCFSLISIKLCRLCFEGKSSS